MQAFYLGGTNAPSPRFKFWSSLHLGLQSSHAQGATRCTILFLLQLCQINEYLQQKQLDRGARNALHSGGSPKPCHMLKVLRLLYRYEMNVILRWSTLSSSKWRWLIRESNWVTGSSGFLCRLYPRWHLPTSLLVPFLHWIRDICWKSWSCTSLYKEIHMCLVTRGQSNESEGNAHFWRLGCFCGVEVPRFLQCATKNGSANSHLFVRKSTFFSRACTCPVRCSIFQFVKPWSSRKL
jgi:hypothetical protein